MESLKTNSQTQAVEGIISLIPVEDATKYGVVVFDENTRRVSQFIEKPKVPPSNKINAGLYLLNTSVLDRMEVILLFISLIYQIMY